MTHVAGGEEAASSTPALAAAFPALGRGLALGNDPPPCKSIVASRNADPLESLSSKHLLLLSSSLPKSCRAKALELGDGGPQG